MGTNVDIEGGEGPLGRLYREAGPQLLAYFRRRHGDPQTAEDLLHETFAAAMRRPDGLAQAVSPRAYLFGMARNLSNEEYRRSKRPEAMRDDLAEADAVPSDPRAEAMREAIMKLNPAFREVLELRVQMELSYEEIAAALEVPIGTVRSRLHHAVKQLRQAMKPAQAKENES